MKRKTWKIRVWVHKTFPGSISGSSSQILLRRAGIESTWQQLLNDTSFTIIVLEIAQKNGFKISEFSGALFGKTSIMIPIPFGQKNILLRNIGIEPYFWELKEFWKSPYISRDTWLLNFSYKRLFRKKCFLQHDIRRNLVDFKANGAIFST